jgi:hypothetical protein
MSRGKTKRPGTQGKSGIHRQRVPTDLPNAAVAALDDLIASTSPFEQIEADVGAAPTPPSKKKRGSSVVTIDDAQVLEVSDLPSVVSTPALRFAVFEDGSRLPAAQGAIVAAGHVVATGTPRAAQVVEAIHGGGVDALLVALPGGESIVEAALALEPRRPVIIASLAGSGAQAVQKAIAAGADLATTRPHEVDRTAPILLAAARLHAARTAAVAARGSEQVLRAKLDDISDADPRGLQPFELFQRQLELELKRAKRYEYPLSVALFAVEIPPPPPPPGILGILRARCGNALIHTVRDIDLATQLDHERFLVLLPYTDLAGAAGLGRRVIAAVAACDPVVSSGRTFAPRVVGAVAGAKPGEALSFAKLMKEATRALDQARKDGAELAVQP